jgi:hypothetical protein
MKPRVAIGLISLLCVGAIGCSLPFNSPPKEEVPEDPFVTLCNSLAEGFGIGVVHTNETDKVLEVHRNWDSEPLRIMGKPTTERYCQIDFEDNGTPGPIVAWVDR